MWTLKESDEQDELLTLRQAAQLAGISEAGLRQYTRERTEDGQPRLRTVRLGEGKTRPHYTTRRWLVACLETRNTTGRGRPANPIPSSLKKPNDGKGG
jgi:hypothetical protein